MGRASNGQPVAGKFKVVSEPRDVVDPQLAEAFAARQASAAYQEMLVRALHLGYHAANSCFIAALCYWNGNGYGVFLYLHEGLALM